MRAGGNRLAGRVAPGAGADQVAARVQAGGQAGGFELAAQPGAGLVEQGRKGTARPRDVGQGKAGQRFNARPQAVGIERRKGRKFGESHRRPHAWRGRRKRPSPFWLTMRWPS
ncbi:hypothetical protein G6F68_014256 [Rhizopus microsporus]|nr:hypothetical protein G6F68_014256 [Rhizopus microsporus]